MPDQSHKLTPYDQFNFEIPQKFPEQGVSAAAANAIVNSETWTDANPMLNLSSFVTTYCEHEAKDLYDRHMFRNFADPDMYPHTAETESQCVRWLHDLWNGPKDSEPYGSATIGSSEAIGKFSGVDKCVARFVVSCDALFTGNGGFDGEWYIGIANPDGAGNVYAGAMLSLASAWLS
jgi:hypothetical protein